MNTYHSCSLEVTDNTQENNKAIPSKEEGIQGKNTKLVTISQDKDQIVIGFSEGIDCLLTLLPDTYFLLSGEGTYCKGVLRVIRETFETYLYKKKTPKKREENEEIGGGISPDPNPDGA